MTEQQIHLVRHGEVHNPGLVLYGRIPGFTLSDRGHDMARVTAEALAAEGRTISRLISSPLERARQSAAPISQVLGLDLEIHEGIIEPTNFFEGMVNSGPEAAFKKPRYWHKFWNPFLPSWGEPYRSVADRVVGTMDELLESTPAGDIVIVSHQSPIWMAHRAITGKPLVHNPAKRRCDLSSVTSFAKRDGDWVEVGYRTPAAHLLVGATDVGAV